jgi:ferredoxin
MISLESVKESCTGCGACSNICPRGSINMKANSAGFLYPEVDKNTCINCHQCEKVCVALNECGELFQDNYETEYKAAWATEENMPSQATSGGVASVLAKNFTNIGHVFGAAFVSKMLDLRHIECTTKEKINAITGSKYLQSNTSSTFTRVKELLNCGERVLYIGTPCQIGGLKKFLNREYENLLTIDFFCHGVPSPLAWEKYVDYLKIKYHADLVSYNFRAKLHGWGKLEQSATFSPKRFFGEVGPFNTYHTWFGKHLSVRSCCFQCKFRSDRRVSDITLADYWKIEQFYPNIPTKQGVSCVILNSWRGKMLFNEAVEAKQLVSYDTSYDSVWKKRKTTQSNFSIPLEREQFLQDLGTLSGVELAKKYPSQKFGQAVIEKIRSIIK